MAAGALAELSDLGKNSSVDDYHKLVALMDANAENMQVQEAAVAAVSRMCSNNFSDRDDQLRTAAVVFGALKRVVDVARAHPELASLQSAACLAVARGCINDDARASVMYVGGLAMAIKAMQTHPGDLALLANACQAIGRLGEDFNEEDYLGEMVEVDLDRGEHPHGLLFNTRMYRGRLRIDKFRRGPGGELGELEKSGLVRVGDSVIKIGNQPTYDLSHHEVANLLGERRVVLHVRTYPAGLFAAEEQAREKLAALAAKKDARRRTIGEQGGVAVVVNAMRAHPDAASLQQWGLFALAKVANQAENLRMVANMNGVELVVVTLRKHEDHAGVQEWGAEALAVLAFDDYSRLQIGSGGGVPALVSGLTRHAAISSVQRSGFKALTAVCAGSLPRRQEALQAGAVSAAAAGLRMHLQSEHVVGEILHAMRVLVDGGGGGADGGAADDEAAVGLGKELAKQKGAGDMGKVLAEVHRIYADVDSIEDDCAALQAHLAKGCSVM